MVIYAVLLAAVYSSTFSWLVMHDWAMEDFNYAYMIPFVVAYLVWEKRDALRVAQGTPSWYAAVILIPGIVLFWIGEISGEYFSQYMSLWLVVTGLCWLHLGLSKLKILAPALVMSLTMFPPPSAVYSYVSFRLKLISSGIGVGLMQTWGLSVHREGNIIDLGLIQLQVVDACSGLRYLVPLVVLGLLITFFYKGSLWKKVVICCSTIPLSIISNSLRIAITGILSHYLGIETAEGFFHDFAGWFIFMFSLGMLVLLMWLLSRIRDSSFPKNLNSEAGLRVRFGKDATPETPAGQASESSVPSCPMHALLMDGKNRVCFLTAVIVLGIMLFLSRTADFREETPLASPLSDISMQIGQWNGVKSSLDQYLVDGLCLSDYVLADYADDEGRKINLYVAYYESQSKGRSVHSPGTCMPGGGWRFLQTDVVRISDPDNHTFPVKRVVMEQSGARHLAYYWFPQRGRVLTSLVHLKAYVFWDALIRHRTDGALVRVITPIYPDEIVRDADERVTGFIRNIIPVLNRHIPQ